MGLLYQFPIHEDEADYVIKDSSSINLKTYGLAPIFWGYYFAALTVVATMFLIIKNPLLKLWQHGGLFNQALVLTVFATLILLPVIALGFFFYEKNLIKTNSSITIKKKVFGIPFYKKTIYLKKEQPFKLRHFMDSPNMARRLQRQDMKAFENRGYFELYAINSNNKSFLLDRSSRKHDLERLQNLLN